MIDESHATIPQIGGMYEGDRSRKTVLVEYGFRLPSALDNRPLNFPEFMANANQLIYVSATPAEFEIKNSIVGNKGYFPHKRERIGEEELVPFRCRWRRATSVSSKFSKADRTAPVPPISRTDQPPEEFDVHTPGIAACCRANHSPDRIARPENHTQTTEEPDRRYDRALPAASRTSGTRSRHYPDEADRGRPFRLPAGCRLESALPAQRHRYDRTGGNPAWVARSRIRHSCRDQPPSRRP